MTTVSPANDITAIGILASHLRVTVQEIERTAEQLRLHPAYRINFVNHYSADVCQKLADAIKSKGSK